MCSHPDPTFVVRPAQWPADFPAVSELLQEYFATLRAHPEVPEFIRSKDRAPELAALGSTYGAEKGSILLVSSESQVLGCVAVHLLANRPGAAELKRLYVRPASQRLGLGRMLVQAAVDWSQAHGARELLLDTLPRAMPNAVRLYRAAGFVPAAPYNANDAVAFAFFRLDLQ